MSKKAETSGPRNATWELFLDGRSVVITCSEQGRRYTLAQAHEALLAGRAVQFLRYEFCPACGTSDGVVEVTKRGRMFPAKEACKRHVEMHTEAEL